VPHREERAREHHRRVGRMPPILFHGICTWLMGIKKY
jgi:hypothetical protein